MSHFTSQAHPRRRRVRRAVEVVLTRHPAHPVRHREDGSGLIMVPLLIVLGMFVLVLVS